MLTQIRSSQRTPPSLTDLLMECHGRIRRFVALARSIGADREAPDEQVADACLQVERYFREALPLHVLDEEDDILPRLRGLSPKVDAALAQMKEDHQGHEPRLQAVLAAASAVRANPADENLRASLDSRAKVLEHEFQRHLELEESIIFPAIALHLCEQTQEEIVQRMRSRRSEDVRELLDPSNG